MDQIQKMTTKLNQNQEELTKKQKYFDEKMTETQKETLWKIQDFHTLMESRISEQKVNDLLR